MDESEISPAGLLLIQHRGAGDVGGHQVGRELDALERHVENLTDGADHQGLGQTRHAHQQAVTAREDRAENLLDYFRLPDYHPVELVDHDAAGLTELSQIFTNAVL